MEEQKGIGLYIFLAVVAILMLQPVYFAVNFVVDAVVNWLLPMLPELFEKLTLLIAYLWEQLLVLVQDLLSKFMEEPVTP